MVYLIDSESYEALPNGTLHNFRWVRIPLLINLYPAKPCPVLTCLPSSVERGKPCWLCPLGVNCVACPICFIEDMMTEPIYASVLTKYPINELSP